MADGGEELEVVDRVLDGLEGEAEENASGLCEGIRKENEKRWEGRKGERGEQGGRRKEKLPVPSSSSSGVSCRSNQCDSLPDLIMNKGNLTRPMKDFLEKRAERRKKAASITVL